MAYYLVISPALAAEAAGYQEGENVFASTVTTDGRHVVAHTALVEFPILFKSRRISLVELEQDDFPMQPRPEGL